MKNKIVAIAVALSSRVVIAQSLDVFPNGLGSEPPMPASNVAPASQPDGITFSLTTACEGVNTRHSYNRLRIDSPGTTEQNRTHIQMVVDLPGVNPNFGGQTGPAWISWPSNQIMLLPTLPNMSLLNNPTLGRFHVNLAPISQINNPGNPWFIDRASISFNGNNVSFRMPYAPRVLTGAQAGDGQWQTGFAFAISFREARFTPSATQPNNLNAATYSVMPHQLSSFARNVTTQGGVVSARFTLPTYNRGPIPGGPAATWQMVSCRDYRSPLVLYFDERRPEFSALTPFKLYGVEQIYSWPEAGAPGSFLALDQNRDGIISNGEELFGDNPATGMRNGFQSLAQHDSNKDGVIDSKDPIWNSLLLWSDRNADGRGRGAELTALPKSPVQSINLRYVSGHTRLMGTGVEGREYSTFVFADEDGRSKHGQIIDLYFEQQPPKRQMASQ